MEETIGLYQLNQYIKQSLELNFSTEIWVRSEISNAKSSRGHFYFDLVEKDPNSNRILAKSQGIVWKTNARYLEDRHGIELKSLLSTDAEMRLLVNVDYHELYGLKLIVTDLDPNYSLGQLELQRRETMTRLKQEGLLEKNAQLHLPRVIQKIAVISSSRAAGYIDFTNELKTNPYGYDYDTVLFDAAVQGNRVPKDVEKALKKIQKRHDEFDAILVLRGGGSKLDLAAFDDYDVCSQLANAPLPVITGIGHEIDISIADMVAHTHLKTPTAAAGFLIQKMADYHAHMHEFYSDSLIAAERLLNYERMALHQIWSDVHARAIQVTSISQIQLDRQMDRLKQELVLFLQDRKQRWDNWRQELELRSPDAILQQGFSVVEQAGKRIRSLSEFDGSHRFKLYFSDGDLFAKKVKDEQEET